jgi:signal transduction histidine kinase
MIKDLRLRTQLPILIFFLTVYCAAVGVSYSLQSRAQSDLEAAFHEDLAVLTKLPRLGDELRHLELLTNEYLLTGNETWISDRLLLIADIRKTQAELSVLLVREGESNLWSDMDKRLSAYLAQQDEWIARKKSGRLSFSNAVRIDDSQKKAFNAVIDTVLAMRDSNLLELQQRRASARRAARLTFYMTLGTGFLVGGLLSAFFLIYVIRPLTELESYASNWELGREWSLKPTNAGPEIQNLFNCLRVMSTRLSSEFHREQDLAQFKSQLVSLVSHEFNNALSVLNGVSVLLEETEGRKDEARRKDYYAMLKGNIRTLHVAANNLLNMGRLESGKFALSPRKTMMRDVISSCIQRLEILSLRKEISVALDVPEAPLFVLADPEAMSLVVTNLLSNAIKYTPEKGHVFISIAHEENDPKHVRVSFRDTGIGIKADEKERIFSGFYRTERGKDQAKGFGVGLSLAKRIVEAHGSTLNVDSKPNKGSVFWFLLPVFEEKSGA